jgi:hypothetical protein
MVVSVKDPTFNWSARVFHASRGHSTTVRRSGSAMLAKIGKKTGLRPEDL